MAYVILDTCIKNGNCATVCPTSAILEGDEQWFIDPNSCIECGLCQPECPVNAIELDIRVPDDKQASVQANADFFA